MTDPIVTRGNQASAALVAELERRHQSAVDDVVETAEIGFDVADADGTLPGVVRQPVISLPHVGMARKALPLSRTAQGQLAGMCDVPTQYAQRIHDGFPELWCRTFQTLLRPGGRVMARQLDGGLRALLSGRYRILDAYDLFFRVFGEGREHGATIDRASLTDDRFEMRLVVDEWETAFDWGGPYGIRGASRLVPGIYVSTSETGKGSLNVRPFMRDKVCSNGMVYDTTLRQVHLGGQQDIGFLSREAAEKDSEATWLKVRDLVRLVFDRDRFTALVEQYRATGELVLENPVAAVDFLVQDHGLTQDDRQAIINELVAPSHGRAAGATLLALLNAVTQRAQAYEDSDPEKATELEELGGKLVQRGLQAVRVR